MARRGLACVGSVDEAVRSSTGGGRRRPGCARAWTELRECAPPREKKKKYRLGFGIRVNVMIIYRRYRLWVNE